MQIDDLRPGQRRILWYELLLVAAVCSVLWVGILVPVLSACGLSIGRCLAVGGGVGSGIALLFLALGRAFYWRTPDVEVRSAGETALVVRNRSGRPVTVRVGLFRLHGDEEGARQRAIIWTSGLEREEQTVDVGPGAVSPPIEAVDPLPSVMCSLPEHGMWVRVRFYGVEIRAPHRYPLYLIWLEPSHGALFMGRHRRSRAWKYVVSELDLYLRDTRM